MSMYSQCLTSIACTNSCCHLTACCAQVSGDSQVYDAPFTDRRVVGVLWSTKVDSFTYFGDNLAFVHGIQVRMNSVHVDTVLL